MIPLYSTRNRNMFFCMYTKKILLPKMLKLFIAIAANEHISFDILARTAAPILAKTACVTLPGLQGLVAHPARVLASSPSWQTTPSEISANHQKKYQKIIKINIRKSSKEISENIKINIRKSS